MNKLIQRTDLSVLHIGSGRYRPNDTSHQTFAIWRELAKGFSRYTVVGRSVHSQPVKYQADGVDVHLLSSRISREAEFLFTQFESTAIAKEVQCDVVVAQCPVQGGLAATRIADKMHSKVLLEFHMGYYFEDQPFFTKSAFLQFLTQVNLRRADRIRVLTHGMREKLIEKYGSMYDEKIVVLSPRVDLKRFAYPKNNWRIAGRPKLVIVGSVTKRKGQLRLLKTLIDANVDFEIWIVGDGPDLPSCKAYTSSKSRTDQVKFFGQVNHEELAALLPSADVMVMFSTMEGTPRAIMEGMAVGLPIITTNTGFCSDIVEHEIQGFVLGDHPTDEVVARLTQIFEDDALRERMGKSAHRRAVLEFDAVKHFERYRRLIRETAVA